MEKRLLILFAILAINSAYAETISVSTCSHSDVQNAVNQAANGDIVQIPADTCSWSAPITLDKDISVIGAGMQSTKISSTGNCFVLDLAYTTRISGIGFTDCTISSTGDPAAGKSFRLDHNSFTSTSWRDNVINGGATTPMLHPTGLIDNSIFHNYRVAVVSGTAAMLAEGNYQHQLWAQDPPKGSGTGVVYIEDNQISSTNDVHQNWVDGSYGGRYVARFNNLSGNTYIEVHSVQGFNRAVQWWEFYKNNQVKSNSNWYPFAYIRGGSGMVWGNSVSNTYTNDIIINNVRSCRNPGNGKCDGSSSWDQNTPGQTGYACRDQIGRSKDNSIWSDGVAYSQPLSPSYFWDNQKGNTQLAINIDAGENCPGGDYNSQHIVENRDWYIYDDAFTGASGIGVGIMADRPVSCTPGVAYWATDEGEWNSRNPGPDGQLYKCSGNNWELHYVPLTYPHPLRAESPICGNSQTDPGEACDGTDVNGYTCSDFPGFSSGSLACAYDCKGYDISQCISGNTINAHTCSQEDVQAAINSASDGDTIIVPSGTCTYTTQATHQSSVTIDKAIVLQATGTTIIDNTGTGHQELPIRASMGDKPVRITGFTFEGASSGKGVIQLSAKNWRIDNNRFMDLGGRGVMVYGDSPGVADHNYFFNTNNGVTPSGSGEVSWNTPLSLGTANAAYIEDNRWEYDRLIGDAGHDAYGGARYVIRHNDFSNAHNGHHGMDSGGYRGTHSFEIYKNKFDYSGFGNDERYWTVMHFRSGTGVVYDNTMTGNYNSFVQLANYRSCCVNGGTSCSDWGRCDGNNPLDGNLDSSGYPCSDQIGRSSDADNDVIQDYEPLYEWNNLLNGQNVDMVTHPHGCDSPNEDDHMQEGRDFINDQQRPGYVPYVYPHPLTQLGECTELTLSELAVLIVRWKSGTININQVMQSITLWKRGC